MKLWELPIALKYSKFRYSSQPSPYVWSGIFLSNLGHQKVIISSVQTPASQTGKFFDAAFSLVMVKLIYSLKHRKQMGLK